MASRFREFLFGNLGLKIASLVLALLLYAHVVTEQPRESVVQIPLTLTGLPDSLTVSGRPPERVGVKIRGRWKDLIRLGFTSPYLPLDLGHATAGVYRATITTDEIVQKALSPELHASALDRAEAREAGPDRSESPGRAGGRVPPRLGHHRGSGVGGSSGTPVGRGRPRLPENASN